MAMICIDEAGNTGTGGGRYFVIAAIEASNPSRLKNIVKHYCATTGSTEIKGTLLKVPERQDLINKLNSVKDYQISYIVLDKTHFQRKDMLGQNVLFNYLSTFVLEDIFKRATGDITLCFDNRTVKTTSKHSLPDYLKIKSIEWNVTKRIDVCFYESNQHRGIQIADLIANTLFQKYKYNTEHFYSQLNIKKSVKFPYLHFGK